MGVIWEREIRSISDAMGKMLKGHHSRPNSSSLRTLFYEIMVIISCRPLTITDKGLSLHSNVPITPKSAGVLSPPGDFKTTDAYSRKDGFMSKEWQQISGSDGEWNIFKHCSKDRNSKIKEQTSK